MNIVHHKRHGRHLISILQHSMHQKKMKMTYTIICNYGSAYWEVNANDTPLSRCEMCDGNLIYVEMSM